MNDQTEKLIRELAEKFGTTAEHLWGVLIQQAPISAATDIAAFLVVALLASILGAIGYKISKSEDYDLPGFMCMALAVLLGFFLCIGILVNAETIVAGFLNPEYWALKQIVK